MPNLREWEDFERSNIFWRAIVKEMEDIWLEDIRDELEDPSGKTHYRTMYRLGGNAQAVRRCINIVKTKIEALKAELEEEDD